MLLVVEKPPHAVGRVQLNEYGPVSPTAEALHVKALPDCAAGECLSGGWAAAAADGYADWLARNDYVCCA